jgi:hypothetical protein
VFYGAEHALVMRWVWTGSGADGSVSTYHTIGTFAEAVPC